jgi:acyl-CoA dehydrogenase
MWLRSFIRQCKKRLPKISDTEKIALEAGGLSMDRDLFLGKKIQLPEPKQYGLKDQETTLALLEKTKKWCEIVGPSLVYPHDKNIKSILKNMAQDGFLGMIISKKYGGTDLSVQTQSRILTTLASFNPSLAVMIMVPNSLGPGELIQKYGTTHQKNTYLPGLASGKLIPCFGLTGPHNGSDALGQIDKGYIERNDEDLQIIRISFHKRYITLAPIADILILAFELIDASTKESKGITLALLERNHPGLLQTTYHNPNDTGFPNGTLRGTNVILSLDSIIGGPANIGKGWKMLMECLAVGRGVSLPATANGSSKKLTGAIFHYIQIRKQFHRSIGNMEAIQQKFVEMFLQTWIIQSSIQLTNTLLDKGEVSSVLSAVMKQQTTERARIVVNHAMDIYAGSGICIGDNNFCTTFYRNTPIGITVEGSNTLTRSLIIFGQGLNKSHPYVASLLESIQSEDVSKFQTTLWNTCLYVSSLWVQDRIQSWRFSPISSKEYLHFLTIRFALLSNFIGLKLGKHLKSKQIVSGNMADLLSLLYLSYSLFFYHEHCVSSIPLEIRDACLRLLYREFISKYNQVIDNEFPHLYPKIRPIPIDFQKDILDIYSLCQTNPILMDKVQQDIYYQEDDIYGKMVRYIQSPHLHKQKSSSSIDQKQQLEEILQVGEYEVP